VDRSNRVDFFGDTGGGRSDLYPCWLARRKTLKSYPDTKLCYDLRVCEPENIGPCNRCSSGYRRSMELATPSGLRLSLWVLILVVHTSQWPSSS
jgi:hypothetical protein